MNPLHVLYGFFASRDGLTKSRLILLACILILTVLGIAFVHSTTSLEGEGFPSDQALNQIQKACVALIALLVVLLIDYRLIERGAYFFYGGLTLVLLALVVAKKILGIEGVMRWIQIGFLNIQPSELMKIALVLTLARYMKFRSDMRSPSGLVVPFGLTLVPFFLVAAQPNLGTALMLPPILLAVLFVSGARRSHLLSAILAGTLLFPALLLINTYLPEIPTKVLKKYQVKRLTAFVQRDEETLKQAGYQLKESLIAFESGGLTGKGYNRGDQNNLLFLPAKHTDFIFAVIGEEWGFLGALTVVVIYFVLVLLCLNISLKTREPFGRLASAAIGVWFAAQGLENFGMTLGLTPITGVPLPFVSYGGSSLVSSFIAAGMVLNIAMRRVRVVASQDLIPREEERVMVVVDDHPAGALRGHG